MIRPKDNSEKGYCVIAWCFKCQKFHKMGRYTGGTLLGMIISSLEKEGKETSKCLKKLCLKQYMIKPEKSNWLKDSWGKWLEDNYKADKETLYRRIEEHDYIKNTLDLKNLRTIKIPLEKMDEMMRLIENKGVIKIMNILIELGIKKYEHTIL